MLPLLVEHKTRADVGFAATTDEPGRCTGISNLGGLTVMVTSLVGCTSLAFGQLLLVLAMQVDES